MIFSICRCYLFKLFNDKNKCIYVGLTSDLRKEMINYKLNSPWWNEVADIEFTELPEELEHESLIYKEFFINFHRPKYNEINKKIVFFNFDFPMFEFKYYNFT